MAAAAAAGPGAAAAPRRRKNWPPARRRAGHGARAPPCRRSGWEERRGTIAGAGGAEPWDLLPNEPLTLPPNPAGSRPWAKAANSGHQVPPIWANPPNTPPSPPALPASMRWVREGREESFWVLGGSNELEGLPGWRSWEVGAAPSWGCQVGRAKRSVGPSIQLPTPVSPIAEEYAEDGGGSSVPPSPYTTPSYLTVPLPPEPSPGPRGPWERAVTPPARPGPGGRRRCDLALLGCATLLGAVGLGADVAEARAAEGEEHRGWLDGLFPRAGRFPRGLSPTGRSPGRRDDAGPGPPAPPGLAPSATLVSLSSVSDCNSTRSLLRSDSDEAAPAAPSPPPSPCEPEPRPSANPLVDLELESFKRDPRQSLTPTHVPAARAASRGHRRTPSDGALGQRGVSEPLGPGQGECTPRPETVRAGVGEPPNAVGQGRALASHVVCPNSVPATP